VAERARRIGSMSALLTVVLFLLGGVLLYLFIGGFRITSEIVTTGPSNPLLKTVEPAAGAWFANYGAYPLLYVVPVVGLAGAGLAWVLMLASRPLLALIMSGLSIAGIILSVGVSMFPIILPSTVDPRMSMSVWDSSSSHTTLFIMLVCVIIFLPIIVAYTSWVYSIMRGKVSADEIAEGRDHAY
jgi:cytochrome d ubiquinol oxidase subunit II